MVLSPACVWRSVLGPLTPPNRPENLNRPNYCCLWPQILKIWSLKKDISLKRTHSNYTGQGAHRNNILRNKLLTVLKLDWVNFAVSEKDGKDGCDDVDEDDRDAVMGCTWLYWALLGSTWLYWAVLGFTGMYWAKLRFTGLHWDGLSPTWLYWAILGPNEP